MLEVAGIETFHGRAQALFGVSLTVAAGEIVALLGRNGMGKTTTIRSIMRLTPPTRGRVTFEGCDLAGLPAYKVARLGLGLVPEGRRIFASLSVAENLVATARGSGWTVNEVYTLFPRLSERRSQPGQTLSGGEQQMLAIGRALLTNPKLLILDEATEGLAPIIRQEIWTAIRGLKARGQAILVVDKSLKELLPVADRCVVLERGANAWTGDAATFAADPGLHDRYLGV